MDPEFEVTSAAEGPEIEETSAAEGPEIEETSAAEGLEIEETSAAEGPEIEETSAAEGPEIEETSATEGPEIEETSAAESPVIEVRRYWKYDSNSSSDSIFRAPAHIRYGRESDFEPKLVSIGPYYHGHQNLQRMENTKVRCMSDLLTKRPVDRVPVDPFMMFERRARSFYKEKFNQISGVEFVRMLVLDSCFIIRIMLSLYGEIHESMSFLEVNIKEVRSDLLLLENQIPLFFINVVYFWLFPNAPVADLRDVLEYFICLDLPWSRGLNYLDFESHHLLDCYWKSSVPKMEEPIENLHRYKKWEKPNWPQIRRSVPKLIANATELHQMAGIIFESNNYYQGLRVEFSKGNMQMLCLEIDSSLATLLVNLIAFENSRLPSLRNISTYIKFMDDLINSEKDVELLQKFGVIYNTLSSHTKAATFFNDIGNLCLIDYERNPFSDLFVNVEKYYKSSWNRRWASLQNNYLNSPWAGISVFAGVILLILTVLQTFYTIYGYYNPMN